MRNIHSGNNVGHSYKMGGGLPKEVGQGHVHKVSNCGIGQRKLNYQSIYYDEQKLFPA